MKKIVIAIFLLAGVLRLSLSVVNYQANDNHYEIIDIIKNRGVSAARCGAAESFHPKLYHCTIAYICKIPPFRHVPIEPFHIQGRLQIVLAQLANCIAGLVTIYIVWLFLKNTALPEKIKLICFSIVALNPGLIGINGQATNDSFVIMFSTAALYSLYLFFKSRKNKYFFYLTAFSILAGLSKGNGLVLFPGILLTFVLKLIASKNYSLNPKKGYLSLILCFFTIYLMIVPVLGQYYYNYRNFGSAFVINRNTDPSPGFFKNTYIKNPGVTSIANSYFTFRIINMLKYPTIANEAMNYPLHRTSVWSQLYGRTHFIFFDMWPPIWQTDNPVYLKIGRIILALALFPSLALLFGIINEAGMWIKNLVKMGYAFINDTNDWIFDIFFFGYFLFIICYTLKYRDFCAMKAIFVFPALLPTIYLFSKGIDRIYRSNQEITFLFDFIICSLLLLYSVSTSLLIYKLTKLL